MPAKPAEYRLTPEAKLYMEAIWLYTLEEWGTVITNKFMKLRL